MKRFNLHLYETGTHISNLGQISVHWVPTLWQMNLMYWLEDRVERFSGSECILPLQCKNKSWMIAYGYSEDDDLDDYAWRHWPPLEGKCPYIPKGELGLWLEIKDDDIAVQLVLSGLLDPALQLKR